ESRDAENPRDDPNGNRGPHRRQALQDRCPDARRAGRERSPRSAAMGGRGGSPIAEGHSASPSGPWTHDQLHGPGRVRGDTTTVPPRVRSGMAEPVKYVADFDSATG